MLKLQALLAAAATITVTCLTSVSASAATVREVAANGKTLHLVLDKSEMAACEAGQTVELAQGRGKKLGAFRVKKCDEGSRAVVLEAVGGKATVAVNASVAVSVEGGGGRKNEGADHAVDGGNYLGNSERSRAHKHFGVVAGGGDVIGGLTGGGIDVFYEASPSLQLGLTYMHGSLALPGSDDGTVKLSNFTMSGSLVFVHARYFVGNSFNVGLALGDRTVVANATIQSDTTTDRVDMVINTNSIVAGLTIGNHWAWESGFTLGCDWIGYFQPLTSSSSSSVSTTGTISAAANDLESTVSDGADKLGKTGSGYLLVLTLGYMF